MGVFGVAGLRFETNSLVVRVVRIESRAKAGRGPTGSPCFPSGLQCSHRFLELIQREATYPG